MSEKFEYFGKYVLLEKLAMGGMAEVFLARRSGAGGIGKFVAIKRILPQFADSVEFTDMFKEEAKIAINLNHSNIVTIHEFGVEKNQFFLVMDYVEGRNLRQIQNKMKKGQAKFAIDQVVYMVKEAAGGLDHAHRCLDGSTGKPLNITHRDISPQNIMMSFEGEVKIVDFGIAKAESQIEDTRAGTLKGKFGYMSPEQAEGQTVDLRTDVFSMGIVLWELLANDRLFIANNEINTLRKIRDCQIPSLRKINPNIHPQLERIVQKALARDRNLRYQTSAALHRDLNRFLNRQYPDFSTQDFSVFIKTLFADDILENRQRLIQYANMPIENLGEETGERSDSTPSFTNADDDKTILTTTDLDIPEETNSYVSQLSDFSNDADEADESPKIDTSMPAPEPTLFDPETDSLEEMGFGDLETEDSFHPPEKSDTLEVYREKLQSAKSERSNLNTDQRQTLDLATLDKLMTGEIQVQSSITKEIPRTGSPQRGRGEPSRKTKLYTQRKQVKQASHFSPVSLILCLLILIGGYYYGARFHPQYFAPLVQTLDPYLGSFHQWAGVSMNEKAQASRTTPEKKTPSQKNSDLRNKKQVGAAPVDENKGLVKLNPAPPLLKPQDVIISSDPSGAEIYLDNVSTNQRTPARMKIDVNVQSELSLRRVGYLAYRKKLSQTEPLPSKLKATLQKALVGYIDIDVRPPKNVRLTIDGKPLLESRLPIEQYAVPAERTITIRAENPYLKIFDEKVIKVPQEQRLKVILNLKARTPSGNP